MSAHPPVRLTWVQPEDLVGHELRQAAQDGRDAREIAERWYAAGGGPAPDRAGASEPPAPPRLRALAGELLDELAALESPLAADEPTDLDAIVAACPHWPGPPEAAPTVGRDRLHAAWLGRAAGCLLGKPVEKLPLDGIRALARAGTTGRSPPGSPPGACPPACSPPTPGTAARPPPRWPRTSTACRRTTT